MQKFLSRLFIILSLCGMALFTACFSDSDSDKKKDNDNNAEDTSIEDSPNVASSSTVRIASISITGDRTKSATFSYDANGFLTRIERDSQNYIGFIWDENGFLSKTTENGYDDANNNASFVDEYTYLNGKLLTAKETETEVESGVSTVHTFTVTFDTWTGYTPTHATFTGSNNGTSFNGEITITLNADGTVYTDVASFGGVPDERDLYTYTENTTKKESQNYVGGTWVTEETTVLTYDSNRRLIKSESEEIDDDGSYETRTMDYTYNAAGNISQIVIVRKDYNSSDVLQNTQTYTAAITYEEVTSRPAPNDILLYEDVDILDFIDG